MKTVLPWDHWLVSLFLKLPRWYGYIETARVGNDTTSYCSINWFTINPHWKDPK